MAEMNKSEIYKTDIDKTDRKILSVIETDARIPVSKLARLAKTSRTVAEYRLEQLQRKGIIRGYYCLLDPSKFGLTVWKLWVSMRPTHPEEKKSFFSYIEHNPRVWWYAQCVGVYDAVICVLAKSPHEFNAFFNSLQEKYGKIITDTAVLINVSFEYHTRGYLLNTQSRLISTSFQKNPSSSKISQNSVQLLKLLCENSRENYAMLAQKTGRNVKTVKSMIDEMKKSGIIVYFRPSIDAAKFGYEYYKVLLYLHNPRGGILPSVVNWCRIQPNIVAVISCVGPWQLELEIETDTFRNLCTLLTELKDKFPDVVKSYETLLITAEGNYQLDLMDKTLRLKD